MSIQASRPGKTAPKFLQDLLRLDPQSIVANRNVLLDHPPQYDGISRPPPLVLDRGSCKHEYITHLERSNLPQLDERPDQHTQWKVAATCKKCRVYLTLSVHYPPDGCILPCPNRDFPLHHLRHTSTSASGVEYTFVCSNSACQATVVVDYSQPILSPADLHLLTDEQALVQRYREVLDNNPSREGVRQATPADVCFRLKRYVSDSLNQGHARRSFPAWNKRFMEAFGTDCDDFLQKLGFEKEDEESENQEIVTKWKLPSPQPADDPLNIDPLRAMLERLTIELQILIDQYCASHATPNPSPRSPWQDAKVNLERTLSAQGYDRVPGRSLNSSEEDHPYYASLGAVGDFSDQLVGFSYDRQSVCDPNNGPYYFDCLHDLATGRSSDYLIMKSTTLASQDVLSKKDIDQSYKAFGLQPEWGATESDDRILGLYRSRWSDMGATGQADLKVALKKLGQARGSQILLDAASDTVETYEQALSWLGAEASQPDDTIVALYGVKVDDSPMARETAQKAIEIIANKRNSESLRSWLATGQMTSTTMSIEEACTHLNIQLDTIDPSMLEFVFDSAQIDRPGSITDKAIAAVRKAFEEQQAPSHSAENWPVGLISHGNTCYLNSLLQYYFTIKPLRELVLNFDEYKYDLATQGPKSERVSNLHRPEYEIESFQKLTDDLRHLFERMIKDRGPAVRPETDLVCRAFLKPTSPDADTTGTQHPDTVDVNMTSNEDEKAPNDAVTALQVEDSSTESQASSVTLQGSVQDTQKDQELLMTPPASPTPDKSGEQLAPPLPPRRPATPQTTAKTNLEKAEEAARQQQDVAEVMEELLTRLRASIKPLGQDSQGEQLDQLRDIFNMRISDTILPEGDNALAKEGDFTNLMLLPPYEPTDIYSALDRVLDLHPEPDANKPVNVYKTLKSFPPILQISINRILMGRDGRPAKSEHRIKLEETLYMDRYSEDKAVLARRKQCWEWRRRLRNLQAEREIIQKTDASLTVDGPAALDGVSDWLSGLSELQNDLEAVGVDGPLQIPGSLATDLSQESGLQRARLTVIERDGRELERQIKEQFAGPDFERIKYRLHAVFFHRGSTGHGHYWTCIYDIQQQIWRVYNDEKVEELPQNKLNDVLDAHTWQHGTPTYAVYVRDDIKEQYVEPLRREVEDQPMPDAVSHTEIEGDWDKTPKPVGINW